MTQSGRPGHVGPFRALGAVLGAAAALALVSAAACLGDLPAYDADGGTGGQDGGGTTVHGDAMVVPAVCGDGIIQRTLPDGGGEACDPGPDAGVPSTASSCSTDCTVLCPGGFVFSRNDHCYFDLPGTVQMSRAVTLCGEQGAHVVTFDDLDEQTAVDIFLGDAGGPYWIALTQDATQVDPIYDVGSINEPGWRASCSGCYGTPLSLQKAPASFLNYCKDLLVPGACVAHDPTNPDFVGANCTGTCEADASMGTGALADAGLGVHTVCEREPAGLSGVPCDDGGVCITLTATKAVYELSLASATWQDARGVCQAKGGDLVVFETAPERAQLSHELSARLQPGAPELNYWVGLQNLGDSGAGWTWVDGTPASDKPSEWADDEPMPSNTLAFAKVEASADGTSFDRQLLHTALEGEPLPYVCEFPAP